MFMSGSPLSVQLYPTRASSQPVLQNTENSAPWNLSAPSAAENVGADVDFLFSAAEGAARFQGAEFSVFCNTGWLEARVGYLWTENALPDINAPELLANGGFYGTATISY